MNWIVRPAARRDLARIALRITLDHGEAAAAKFKAAVETEFARIAAQPALLGHQMGFRKHADVRSRVVPGYPWLIFFRLGPRHVEFKRVLHGAQHLPRFFRR